MPEFINEFAVTKQIERLQLYVVSFDQEYSAQKKFSYKVSSQTSRNLSEELKVPVASFGEMLVTSPELELPKTVTTLMKIAGTPTEVEVTITKKDTIDRNDNRFNVAVQKYLNRFIDLVMAQQGYSQDGRGFYEKRTKDVGKYYMSQQGIFVNTQAYDDGTQTIVVDPLTQNRSKLNLLEALKLTLKEKEIDDWKNVGERSKEINQVFRSRAYSLRSTYVEPRGEDLEHNSYRFVRFDFQRGLQKNGDPKNPVNFHESYGRKFTMDQPIVEAIAHGGFGVTQIPELLEESPSLHMLKRFGVSERLQARSLMDASARFYTTYSLMKPLVQNAIVQQEPMLVQAKDFSPVRLTVEGGYIELRKNYDFQKYFQKKRVLKKPSIKKIHIFATEKNADNAEEFVNTLLQAFQEFGLTIPPVQKRLNCPEKLDEFRDYVLRIAIEQKFGKEDLMLVILDSYEEDLDDALYNSIKKASFNNLFPVQVVSVESISDEEESGEEKDLRRDIVNPLFLQIIAKCGGQPYGLQPGFAPIGTVFVAIDRYRNPFKANSPLITSVVFFDNEGSYVCSKSEMDSGENEISLSKLLRECFAKLRLVKNQQKWNLAIYMEDTGMGTMEEQLKNDVKECEVVTNELGSKYVFITANKGSHHRLYSGDPTDRLSANRVSPFTAALGMKKPNQILVVSTEPIITKKASKEIGTPKPVLYTVYSLSADLDLEEIKEDIAKSIIWLCRHSWVSPTSTRLPAPLYFGNKLSKLVSATGKQVTPNDMEAPLFL
jgi:hypothetical protein